MRSFILTLLLALFATSYAFPWVDTAADFTSDIEIREPKKAKNKNATAAAAAKAAKASTAAAANVAARDFFPTLWARKGGKGNDTNGDANTKQKGNGTEKNTANKACKTMAKLTKLTELAANQTKLDAQVAKGKLTTEEVDKIKAKAANATTELSTMTSNTTLVQECAVVDAHQAVVKSCKKRNKLEKLAALANNQTAMDAMVSKKGLNDTQVTKLKEKIANATTKLTTMQSNTTLTDLCASENSQKGTTGAASGGATASGSGATAQATGGAGSLIGHATGTVPFIAAVGAVFAIFL